MDDSGEQPDREPHMIGEETKKVEGAPNACCRDPENIELLPTDNPLRITRHCRLCGCNHYLMIVEPFHLGVRIAKT